MIQVYINGQGLMKHVFNQSKITYRTYDNCYLEISELAKTEELSDKSDPKKLCLQLDFFAHKVNPYTYTAMLKYKKL